MYWDYGDWINWFGQSKAVLRGDNQVPSLDYETAYMFVNANMTQLADFMKQENASLLLLSQDDLMKWSALNYLSCIYQNETNVTMQVGQSSCELNNEPVYMYVPTNLNSLNDYCTQLTNSTTTYLKALGSNGNTYCLQEIYENNQPTIDGRIYDTNGTQLSYLNLIPVESNVSIGSTTVNVFMLLYEPTRYTVNNVTYCDMPANAPLFYHSNYYMLYMMGCTNGIFEQVYPSNDAFGQVRIWKLAE